MPTALAAGGVGRRPNRNFARLVRLSGPGCLEPPVYVGCLKVGVVPCIVPGTPAVCRPRSGIGTGVQQRLEDGRHGAVRGRQMKGRPSALVPRVRVGAGVQQRRDDRRNRVGRCSQVQGRRSSRARCPGIGSGVHQRRDQRRDLFVFVKEPGGYECRHPVQRRRLFLVPRVRGSAPAFSSAAVMERAASLVFSATRCRGVFRSLLRAAGSAPALTNRVAIEGIGLPAAARCRGVFPLMVRAFGSAPAVRSASTTETAPVDAAARWRGVVSSSSCAVASAPAARRALAAAVLPVAAAPCRGVSPINVASPRVCSSLEQKRDALNTPQRNMSPRAEASIRSCSAPPVRPRRPAASS